MKRHPEVLVAPLVALASVVGLLCVARIYHLLPVRFPACSFRQLSSLPCPGCGGTRSMQALSRGHLLEAWLYHPLFTSGVILAIVWTVWKIVCYWRGCPPLSTDALQRRARLGAIVFGAALLLNWVYLLFFLR